MFKNTVSALLVVSVLSWTVGCTTTKVIRESDSLAQYQDKKIEVRTKDGSRYILSHWTRNASEDYTGTGRHIQADHDERFSGTIAADRIEAVKVTKAAAGKTVLLVGGVILLSLGAAIVIIFATADFGS